jgi:hypothetical protein
MPPPGPISKPEIWRRTTAPTRPAGRCEDGVALIGAEGEAGGGNGVLPRTAGNLKRRAQVADREGRAQAVGVDDRKPIHRRVGSAGHPP